MAANDYGMLKTKVDAKGQKVEYIYDAYKRVIEVKRYKLQSDTNPDACQGTKYQYDLNTWDVGFGAGNLSGRLSGVEYHVCTYNTDGTLEKDRTIREMYSYSTSGRPLKKRMQLQRTDPLGGSGGGAPITGIANLDAEYTWSQEGTLLTLKYPDLRTGHPNQMLAEKGNTITYQTDWLRRYSGMTETSPLNPGNPTTLVSGMQYGISGELTSMTYNQPTQSSNAVVTETRQYNLLGQLTQITAVQGANTVTNLQYVFPTGTNNGRISSMVNVQSGETVTYTYDALNRLTNAVGSGWSEAYAFDGFGNLTQKGAQSIGVLAASNRLTGPGVAYDSNGNQTGMQVGTTNVTNTFDVENRLLEVSGQGFRHGFGPDNRKMWTRNASNGNEDYVFWGPQGKPIGTYRAAWEWTASSGTLWFNAVVSTRRWMGGKEISATSVLIHDRLSSVVGVSAGGAVSRFRYLPYGEPNTAGGSPVGSHYATYDRMDAGMYYADQRYYRDGVGRFLTADPYQASGGPSDPRGWNRYSYARGDGSNAYDPRGLYDCPPGTPTSVTVCAPPLPEPPPAPPSGLPPDETEKEREEASNGRPGPPMDSNGLVGKISTNNVTNRGPMHDTIMAAVQSLAAFIDPTCKSWLSGGKQTFDDYVRDVIQFDLIGHGEITTTAPNSYVNAVTGPSDAPGYAIVISINGAFFAGSMPVQGGTAPVTTNNGSIAGGTIQARMFILLHEFAHSNQVPGFRSDANNPNAGRLNNQDVTKQCGQTLARFR